MKQDSNSGKPNIDNLININIDRKRLKCMNQSSVTYVLDCPIGCEASNALDKDYNYFNEIYPDSVKSIQVEVRRVCDELDYQGSFMYDEVPSKVRLDYVINYTYRTIINNTWLISSDCSFLRNLVTVLLYNEFQYRRRIYRREQQRILY